MALISHSLVLVLPTLLRTGSIILVFFRHSNHKNIIRLPYSFKSRDTLRFGFADAEFVETATAAVTAHWNRQLQCLAIALSEGLWQHRERIR